MANLQKVTLSNGEVITAINKIDKIKEVAVKVQFDNNYEAVVKYSLN